MKNKIKILGKWEEDLIWCPSQCYLPIEFNGKKYTIYLRWRHQNPWEGHIWEGAWDNTEAEMSPDLFALYHEQYSDKELKLAEKRIVLLAEKYLNKINKKEK